MSTKSIAQIRNLAAVAEELIDAGYGIYTIYADQNEMHVDFDSPMLAPCQIDTISTRDGPYDHCHGKIGGVTITWLVEKKMAVAA